MFHLRRFARLWGHEELEVRMLIDNADEPYFVPAGTPLHTQLRNFQLQQERIGLVVNEYGEIEGLVTLEDVLEEIVGEFTTDPAMTSTDVHPQADGTYLIDGAASIRQLNRTMAWELPTEGPRTLTVCCSSASRPFPNPERACSSPATPSRSCRAREMP